MTPAARVQTAIELLDAIMDAALNNGASADVILAKGFRERRYAGSKDRRAIRDLVYRVIRAFGAMPVTGRAGVIGLGDADILAEFGTSTYGPPAVEADEPRLEPTGLPQWMQEAFLPFVDAAERTAMMARAPLDLRVNTLKATVAEVMADYPEAVQIPVVPFGLRLDLPVDVENDDAYQSGSIEVQDAGSQIISAACLADAGMTVVDLCAGAGGKTLALAADMKARGHLIACDTDRARLQQLPKRAERAGATVETRLLNPKRELDALADLEGQADVVLVDAPCSGSGTWRRNPELRWRLTPERLERTLLMQRHVLDVAAQLVKPGGRLVYAVCSLFGAEGPEQMDRFLELHPEFSAEQIDIAVGRPAGHGRALTPLHDATDGFFVARLARSC